MFNGGNTENPDLVSVQLDGDQLLFKFDERINQDDDIVQNTSGLRFYTQNAETFPSSMVKERGPRTLSAIYDLPPGVTLDDAIGGFVVAGTVVGDQPNQNDLNELDEEAIFSTTQAEVCPAAPATGETGDGSGPTEAPDLLEVDNFRRGPFTDDYEPTTCVDFTFDQVAYLNGGTRSNFHLVPLDGSDALDGSTNQTPESDEEGDIVVTVIFPGDIEPNDFARGYVDTGVVNSDPNTINSDNPANINQAGDIEPRTLTENPDLVDVERDGENSALFTFDEDLTTDDVAQNSSGLRVYFPRAEQGSTIPFASSSRVEVVDSDTLRAFYDAYPGDYTLADAVGAYVVQGAVQAAQGSRGGNNGANAFDEVLIAASPNPDLTCNDVAVTIDGRGRINGTSGDDVILGSDRDDTIKGRGGDDLICGAGGDDDISGNGGVDTIFGDAGSDTLAGGGGDDTIRGGGGGDTMAGRAGDDDLVGGQGNDTANGGPGTDACTAEETSNCER